MYPSEDRVIQDPTHLDGTSEIRRLEQGNAIPPTKGGLTHEHRNGRGYEQGYEILKALRRCRTTPSARRRRPQSRSPRNSAATSAGGTTTARRRRFRAPRQLGCALRGRGTSGGTEEAENETALR